MRNRNYNQTIVYLCFSGYQGDPDEITSLISLRPSSIHKVGQRQIGPGVSITRSFWSAKLIEAEGNDVGKLVDEGVSKLIAKSSVIASVSKLTFIESYIGVTIRVGSNKPSINISSETLKRMADMILSLDVGLFD